MQGLPGFARKYAIMEELDEGFGTGHRPEAFVRLDSWDGRIQASLNVKGLKQGPYTYKLYLIFARSDRLIPLPAGTVKISYSGMQSGLEIDSTTLKSQNLKPDLVRFAAITAESQDKKWIPLFASFEKNFKWDESIRQVMLKKPVSEEAPMKSDHNPDAISIQAPEQNIRAEDKPDLMEEISAQALTQKPAAPQKKTDDIIAANTSPLQEPVPISSGAGAKKQVRHEDNHCGRCDINKLEGLLINNFEAFLPFKPSNIGYSWYRVSDLAKLSNIMYMSGVNVPLFANPKILVGLFKFKHILAGIYRGDDGSQYYVIGVPARNDKDNKPFENACRWVPVSESRVRDMGGYWLVYVSLKSGEIVV